MGKIKQDNLNNYVVWLKGKNFSIIHCCKNSWGNVENIEKISEKYREKSESLDDDCF